MHSCRNTSTDKYVSSRHKHKRNQASTNADKRNQASTNADKHKYTNADKRNQAYQTSP